MSKGEDLNRMSHLKRESNFLDEDSVSKKSKVNISGTERAEKEGEKSDTHILEGKGPVSTETNGDGRCSSDQDFAPESRESRHVDKDNISTENMALPQSTNKISVIEADAAEDKGSRHNMEDAWVILPEAGMESPGKLRCAHFAIYDGHGGRLAAKYAQNHLHANVLSAGLPRELMDVKAAKKAILEGFQRTDESLLQESAAGGWQDGATAVCVWILGQTVFVANIGDAKAVLARSSADDGSCKTSLEAKSPLKAIVITREHKAIYPQERARIQKTGGSVASNGRLQGRIEVSRAFGDRQFKKVGVIAIPDVHSFELTEREKFIILGCDGLWGVFGPSDAVDFVQKHLQDGLSATAIARRLVREAVRERRCKDNCTAIIIIFRHD